jgi:hypothetical protein
MLFYFGVGDISRISNWHGALFLKRALASKKMSPCPAVAMFSTHPKVKVILWRLF